MSSACGELQGQTALAIISYILLQSQNATTKPTIFIGNNKGVQQNYFSNHQQQDYMATFPLTLIYC